MEKSQTVAKELRSRALEWLLPSEAGGDCGLLIWPACRDAEVDAPIEVTTASQQPLLGSAKAVELQIYDRSEPGQSLGTVSVHFSVQPDEGPPFQVLSRNPALTRLSESLVQILEQEENYRECLAAIASALEKIKDQRAARTSRAVVQ